MRSTRTLFTRATGTDDSEERGVEKREIKRGKPNMGRSTRPF